jgi:sulfite reductase (ferredoxin)
MDFDMTGAGIDSVPRRGVPSIAPGIAPAPILRGEGQWAFGHTEPLNHQERIKREDPPLGVRARIAGIYALRGSAGIPDDDLHVRFRWWGLRPYPVADGIRFTLRIRVDGGRLSMAQAHTVAVVAARYADGTVLIDDGQCLRVTGVRVEDVPEIWRLVEGSGLSTAETDGDCPWTVLGNALSGVIRTEVLDAGAAIEAIVRRHVGDPALENLPGRFTSVVSWLHDAPYPATDVSFLGAVHPDLGPGFDLWAGGAGPAAGTGRGVAARRLAVWLSLAEVPDVWTAVAEVYRDYGYRRTRQRGRLLDMVADWGTGRFRDVVEAYLGRPLADSPTFAGPPPRDDRHPRPFARWSGRISAAELSRLAAAAEAGNTLIRLTASGELMAFAAGRPS